MWKVTQIPEGQQELTSVVKALECQERNCYAVHNTRGFLLHWFCKTHLRTKFTFPEAYFHADVIVVSFDAIACKTAESFQALCPALLTRCVLGSDFLLNSIHISFLLLLIV